MDESANRSETVIHLLTSVIVSSTTWRKRALLYLMLFVKEKSLSIGKSPFSPCNSAQVNGSSIDFVIGRLGEEGPGPCQGTHAAEGSQRFDS